MRNQYILLSTVCCGLFFRYGSLAAMCGDQGLQHFGIQAEQLRLRERHKMPLQRLGSCPCDASYIYTCTGTNESPSSAKCGDKYSMCNCATGTHWDSSSGSCVAWTVLHAQSAGFITATVPVRHQPLIQPAKRFWVLWFMSTITVSAVKLWHHGGLMRSGNRSSSGVGMAWGGYGTDISSLPNMTNSTQAEADFDSCGNTDKIVAAGSASTYPAAWATRNMRRRRRQW